MKSNQNIFVFKYSFNRFSTFSIVFYDKHSMFLIVEFVLKSMIFFSLIEYIDDLPLTNTPEVFGLHPNAEIGYYTKSARDMWEQLIELQPQSGKKIRKSKMKTIDRIFVFF